MNWWPFGKKTETRDLTSWDLLQGTTYYSATGTPISPEAAAGHAVAHRCISVIAENLASVPLVLYRKTADGGREPATDHPLHDVLQSQSSSLLTAYEAREALIVSCLLFGNAFAKIERNGRGQVAALHPIPASRVSVEQLASGRLRYRVSPITVASTETLLADEILHLRYRLDRTTGFLGQSPISIAAATFGLALSQQEQAGSAAENAFRPSGLLTFPDKLSGAGKEDIITKFQNRLIGSLKANQPLVLDGGATWSNISFNSKDSEFLASRQLSNLDVCRIFGVPPTAAGIVDQATYSNVEGESRALVQRCLQPWAKRIEQTMNVALLSPESRKSLFIEHDLDGLLHGSLVDRYNAYRVGREGGWLSTNEIRSMENMSKIPDGDQFVQALNMGLVGANDNKAKIDEAAA
ncbi:phage portal protein [Mesorhizobium sp. WSM3626]|uniref:phage portal protein n=1 Tax=Mesorhizobium sp. WSM3626 TaxID=1040987 RepID=UPI000486D6A0|nr:phage portal protein [Mesorhizobium sp. WSM3626]